MPQNSQPLEQRLSDILPEVPASDAPPDPDLDPADTGDDQDIQVAQLGPLTDLITKGGKLVREGQAAKKAAQAAEEAAKAVPAPVPQPTAGAGRGVVNPPAVTPAAPAAPRAQATAGQIRKLEQQMETIEQTIDTAATTGKPPDILINLDRIDGPEDFKKTVDALATSSGVQVERMTWEETLALAKEKGFSQDLMTDLAAMKKQYGEIPVDVLRLRLASYQNINEFYDLARQSYANPDDQELMAKLLYKLSLQNGINETYILARTRSAQGTAIGGMQITEGRAAGIMDEVQVKIPAVSDAEMKTMLSDPQVAPNLKVLVEKFVQLTDDGAREGLLNKVSKVGLISDLWDRTWKNGLLSATGTHIVNLSSNTTFLASSVATRALAGLVGTAKRSVGLNAEVEMGEAAAMLAGMVSAFREGMGLGWTALKTGSTREMREGMDLLGDAGQKLEGQYNIFNARDYGIENEALIKGINGYANFVTLLGGRPIMAMDEVFKLMGYRAELYAQAYRAQAQTTRAALDAGKPADEAEMLGLNRMAEILTDPPKNIDDAATDFSQMITFSRKLTGSAAKIQELSQEHLLGRITMPFVKTPVWVASESMQHSMIAPLSAQWRADFVAGGAKRELAMAKWGMGTMLMLGVGSYVADGRITGGGPGDTNLRKVYMDSGWRPYSFVFQNGEWDQPFIDYLRGVGIDPSVSKDGKLYVPFRGIDPIAGPLAMMADAVEYGRYEDNDDVVGQWILGATWGLYNYVGQLPFMQGISSIAGAFSQSIPNPKAAFRAALDGIASSAAQYAIEGSPVGVFSSARAMIERGVDNTKRMTSESPNLPTVIKGFYEGFNKVLAKTPFLSDSLPAQYDYLGEEMTDVDPANPWLASTSGVRFSYTKQRPADKVMIQLGMSIKKPDWNLSNGNVSIKLETDEYAYLMQQLGRVTDGSGRRLKDAIVDLANSPGFQALGKDDQQINMRDLYGNFVKSAKGELLTNSKFSDSIQRRLEMAENRLPRVGIYAK